MFLFLLQVKLRLKHLSHFGEWGHQEGRDCRCPDTVVLFLLGPMGLSATSQAPVLRRFV
jgi:hypothetical protein